MESNDKSNLNKKYPSNKENNEEKKQVKKLTKSDPAFLNELEFQKRLFESAADEDFKEIFPKLKAAEKKYLSTQTAKPFIQPLIIKRLVFAAILVVILILCWQLFLSR